MYLQETLSENTKIYFSQETMDKGSRMIVIEYDNGVMELFCSSKQARDLANSLLESINKFEDKWD